MQRDATSGVAGHRFPYQLTPRTSGASTLRGNVGRYEDVTKAWNNGQNIGLLTGEPSGWLVDVDLDCPEAVKIAERFLPSTLTSGRASNPDSHWWYVSPDTEYGEWIDTDNKKKLIELRGTGRQTLVEPSIHTSG